MANEKRTGSYDPGPQLPSYMRKNKAVSSPKRQGAQAKAAPQKPARQKSSQSSASAARPVQRGSAASSGSASKSKPAQASNGNYGGYYQRPQATQQRSQAYRQQSRASGSARGGAASASSNGRGSGANTKRRKKKASNLLKWIALAAAALICVIVIVSLSNNSAPDAVADMDKLMQSGKRFKAGVRLIGVDVSGMTPEEATGLVKNAAEKKLKTVAVTIKAGDDSWTLDSTALGMDYDIAQALADGLNYGRTGEDETVEITGGTMGEYDANYTWDKARITAALSAMSENVNKEATNAYARPITDWASEERFEYVAGDEGRTLNVEATAEEIENALSNGEFVCEINAIVNAVLPAGNIDDIKAETQLISSYTTKFSAPRDDEIKQNRKFNIQKAADIINGNIVQPGEQWSFNTIVGPRTIELGWKPANGISGGKEYTLQAGGGICQVSTTLYNALLCANMEIVDRRAHTIPSDYVPVGLDATVDTRGIDFVWRNNTDSPAYIFAQVAPVEGSSRRNVITVYIYGAPLPEGVTYKSRNEILEERSRIEETIYTNDPTIPQGYQLERIPGHKYFVAEAYQDMYVNGELKESKLLYTDKYKGNPPEILVGTGAPLAAGQQPDAAWQPYGTAPTDAN